MPASAWRKRSNSPRVERNLDAKILRIRRRRDRVNGVAHDIRNVDGSHVEPKREHPSIALSGVRRRPQPMTCSWPSRCGAYPIRKERVPANPRPVPRSAQ
jgi:hypothetical protein